MTTLQLRGYQEDALSALYAYWREDPGSPLLVLPTGSGKSLVMAALMQDLLKNWPDMRLACVTHVRELISQNFQELTTLWPSAPAGIYSAGLGRRETQSKILFCGIQSVRYKADQIGHVDVLMVDEAHLIPRSVDTSYGIFIHDLLAINPDLKIVGLTATPYRLDSGRLDEVDPKTKAPPLFSRIAYEIGIQDLIEQGYLSPLISKATATTLDVSGVHHRGGEFIASELEAAVNKDDVTKSAVREMIRYGHDRRSWLVFCSGVKHAYAVAEELRKQGIDAATIEGTMNTEYRDRVIGAFRTGKLRAITNMNVLTTGFNVPQVDLLALLRPTESTGLYVQMVGRASRNAPGKTNALILDFARNIARHGPVDAVMPRKPGEKTGDAPVKICPACASIVHASARTCPDCGYVFIAEMVAKHDATASSEPILARAKPEWLPVKVRQMSRHEKPFGTPSVRIDYFCGLTAHRAWICPEHQGFPRKKFEQWWRDHGGSTPAPASVEETLARTKELRPTERILLRPTSGRYFEVVGYVVSRPADEAAA